MWHNRDDRWAEPLGGSSIDGMSLWVLLVLLAAIKVPLAALMLWIPFRSDEAMTARHGDAAAADGGADDGGSKTLPGGPGQPYRHDPRRPLQPRPIGPRRGPHGGASAPSPARVRTGAGERSTVVNAR